MMLTLIAIFEATEVTALQSFFHLLKDVKKSQYELRRVQ
jgi:hypothetical protein